MKTIKAVAPYNHPGSLNFKRAPYEAWVKLGGRTAKPHYPIRFLHGLAFRWELPTCWKNKREVRLRFVEPVSISFDTFPDYTRYEIIPFVWDCWPCYFEKTCQWLKKHHVRTAIFTSSQTADRMKSRFPQMHIMYCPEGIDTSLYQKGKILQERTIDLLEYGRTTQNHDIPDSIHHVTTSLNNKSSLSNEQLYAAMADAKITYALPCTQTQPDFAGDIETLTQRYWEAMLSRMVMVGHAPKELTDLIGYNPVIDIDKEHSDEQIIYILAHIGDYQELVDKNRETALRLGDWTLRMRQVMAWLQECGYQL